MVSKYIFFDHHRAKEGKGSLESNKKSIAVVKLIFSLCLFGIRNSSRVIYTLHMHSSTQR